jgi:hypothetical protein
MKDSILQKLENINDEQALKRLTDSIFKLTHEELKEREAELASLNGGQHQHQDLVDGISEEEEDLDETIDIDYGESKSGTSDEEQGENQDNQSERLETTVIKGPDGSSRVIKMRKRRAATAKKRRNDNEEDRQSVASRASLFKSKSRVQVTDSEVAHIALKPSLYNATSRKRLSAEEELERERKARLDLEKDF